MRRRMVFRSNFEENSSVGGVVYAREYFTRDPSCKGTLSGGYVAMLK